MNGREVNSREMTNVRNVSIEEMNDRNKYTKSQVLVVREQNQLEEITSMDSNNLFPYCSTSHISMMPALPPLAGT